MRWLVQGGTIGWLLLLSFWVWLVQFNKYGDSSVVDCDRDAEVIFLVSIALIWLTTLIIWTANLILKYWRRVQPFWFVSGLSAFLSIAFIPKFIGLIQHNAELMRRCP